MTNHYTAEQRTREDELARRIERAWPGRHLDPTTVYCPIDYFMTGDGGRLLGAVEVKIRSCRSDAYPDVLVRADKVIAVMTWGRFLRVPALLVIAYTDDVDRWVNLSELPELTIRQDGRNDRSRGGPTAAHAHLPRERFKTL